MGSAYNPEMTTWLQEVQRDPRTLGAVRRRIENVLRDPMVARRVSCRLIARKEAEEAARPRRVANHPGQRDVPVRGGAFAALLEGLRGATTTHGSIIGRCNCTGACCLMVADLRACAAPADAAAPPMLRF